MKNIYKVVKIVNEYKVVVNAGSNDLIQKGQCLEIFAPGREVIDPDTNESLGVLDYVKAKLYVKDVFPKMSLCVNQDSETVSILTPTFQMERSLPLNVDSKEISGGFEGIDKKIRVGDMVRTID